MKKLFAIVALVALATAGVLSAADTASSSPSSWTGWITDSHCGKGGANAKHTQACAEKCAKDGKILFFNEADQKLYSIDKSAEALPFVGVKVKVTGTVEGDMIKVSSFEKAEKPAA